MDQKPFRNSRTPQKPTAGKRGLKNLALMAIIVLFGLVIFFENYSEFIYFLKRILIHFILNTPVLHTQRKSGESKI